MTKEEQNLRRVLYEIYEAQATEVRVNPAWLATAAMLELDGERQAPPLVHQAAHLQLRQLARGICRNKFEVESEETEQSEMFPNLQARYPAAHSTDAEPEYVLLEHLTDEDVKFNVNRLRKEADAKLHHANALEAWWKEREAATGT